MEDGKREIWGSYSFWMLLCCAIPLGGIVLLSFLGILGTWGLYALILLCPLLHFVFMRRMASKNLQKRPSRNEMMGSER
jgi:hypothetical protein